MSMARALTKFVRFAPTFHLRAFFCDNAFAADVLPSSPFTAWVLTKLCSP